MELIIDNRQEKIDLQDEIINELETVIAECLKFEGKPLNCEVSLSFVDNVEIRELNKDYRGKDNVTDVLSFPLMERYNDVNEGFPILLGDIVISLEMALKQSKEYGHSLKREVFYLTVHSMLHLLGYDHMKEDEKSIMRGKEKQIMKSMGIFKN